MNNEFDAAYEEIMRKLESGELYEEQRQAMRDTGVDPDKPIEITFADGTKESFIPNDSIKHLKRKDADDTKAKR